MRKTININIIKRYSMYSITIRPVDPMAQHRVLFRNWISPVDRLNNVLDDSWPVRATGLLYRACRRPPRCCQFAMMRALTMESVTIPIRLFFFNHARPQRRSKYLSRRLKLMLISRFEGEYSNNLLKVMLVHWSAVKYGSAILLCLCRQRVLGSEVPGPISSMASVFSELNYCRCAHLQRK